MAVQNNVEVATSLFSGTFSKLGSLWWLWVLIAVLGIFGAVAFFAVKLKGKNNQWNIKIRIRQEDTENKRIYLDPTVIKGRRVTLSNHMRMIYLEKPIQGKRLMPLLNHYTRPNVYDLILTADNRLLILTGITGVDKIRKELNIGIRFPGIDNDFDELNAQYAKLNKQDKFNNLLEIIKAASTAIIAIVFLVGLIVGGNYWLEGKKSEAAISQAQIEVFDGLRQTSKNNLEFSNSLNLLIPKLEEMYGTKNLNKQIKININNST